MKFFSRFNRVFESLKNLEFKKFFLVFFLIMPFLIGLLMKFSVFSMHLSFELRQSLSVVLALYTFLILTVMFRLSKNKASVFLSALCAFLCIASFILAGSHSPMQLIGGLVGLSLFR